MRNTLHITWMLSVILAFNRFHFINAFSRIVNGTTCDVKNHPYYIGIKIMVVHQNGKLDVSFCGGSLIRQSVVLTAAHCCKDDSTFVAFSSLTKMEETPEYEQRRVTEEFKRHPKYNPTIYVYDLCLIKFKKDFDLTEGTQLVNLATPDSFKPVLEGNTVIDLMGYGNVWSSSKGSVVPVSNEALQCTQNKALGMDGCLEYFKSIGEGVFDASIAFCSLPSDNQGVVCFGDSGGPVMYSGTQVGVNSFVIDDCGGASVFARVDSELEFLTQELENNVDGMLVSPMLYTVHIFFVKIF